MNVTKVIKKIFSVILLAILATNTTMAMGEASDAPAKTAQTALAQAPYRCEWITDKTPCGHTCDSEQAFCNHLVEEHCYNQTVQDGKFRCKWMKCTYEVAYRHNLVRHIKIKHTGKTSTGPHCTFGTTQESFLTDHIRAKHTSEEQVPVPQAPAPAASTAITMEIAPVEFTQAALTQKTQKEPRPCKWITDGTPCHHTFDLKHTFYDHEQAFYDHVKEHYKQVEKVGGKFHCEWEGCPYNTDLEGRFAQHCARHVEGYTGKTPYKCTKPRCTYHATQQRYLDTHIRERHTDEKIVCSHRGCYYITNQPYKMEAHISRRHKQDTATRKRGLRGRKAKARQERKSRTLAAPTLEPQAAPEGDFSGDSSQPEYPFSGLDFQSFPLPNFQESALFPPYQGINPFQLPGQDPSTADQHTCEECGMQFDDINDLFLHRMDTHPFSNDFDIFDQGQGDGS